MANNFQNGPGGRLQKEEEKNVNFGFMRPRVSPLNQQQFMQVARGEMSPQQTGVNAPVVFGQKPGSIGEKIGQALTLGKKPYPGQGFQFTPSETAKQTAIDLATGEAIGAGVKAAAPYVKPAMNKAIQYITTQTPLRDAYKLNPFAFKPNAEAYYRGIGRSGLDDAMESGVLRTANKTGDYGDDLYMTSDFNMAKGNYSIDQPTYKGDPFGEADDWEKILPKDTRSYMAEIPKNAVTDLKNPGSIIYFNKGSLPLKDIKLLKQDWLQGYKPIKFK